MKRGFNDGKKVYINPTLLPVLFIDSRMNEINIFSKSILVFSGGD